VLPDVAELEDSSAGEEAPSLEMDGIEGIPGLEGVTVPEGEEKPRKG
jgi:hypothetical protein